MFDLYIQAFLFDQPWELKLHRHVLRIPPTQTPQTNERNKCTRFIKLQFGLLGVLGQNALCEDLNFKSIFQQVYHLTVFY